jgi:hypothetical protein
MSFGDVRATLPSRTMPESHPLRTWAGVRCAECGREDDGSAQRGWKAYQTPRMEAMRP